MARIEGIGDKQANVFTRFVYAAVRRKLGRVPEPMRITAHQPKLLAGVAAMEMAQEAMRTVDPRRKGAGRDQGRHADRVSVLNRHRFCGRQKGGSFRSQTDGAGGFRKQSGVHRRREVGLALCGGDHRHAGRVGRTTLFAAMQARFDARQLVELTGGDCLGKLPGALQSCFRMPGGRLFPRRVLSAAANALT